MLLFGRGLFLLLEAAGSTPVLLRQGFVEDSLLFSAEHLLYGCHVIERI